MIIELVAVNRRMNTVLSAAVLDGFPRRDGVFCSRALKAISAAAGSPLTGSVVRGEHRPQLENVRPTRAQQIM